MTRPPCLIAIQELEQNRSPHEQVRSLQLLKNDIVGHTLRKELAIKNGILAYLKNILSASKHAGGKRSVQHVNGSAVSNASWSAEEEACLQAILIAGILANAGPTFMQPILASNLPAILANRLETEKTRLIPVLATLQTLNDFAKAWTLTDLSTSRTQQSPFASQLFSKSGLRNILFLLQQPVLSRKTQKRLSLTSKLIAVSCTDDISRAALVREGVLDVLAGHIANYALHDPQNNPQLDMGPDSSPMSLSTFTNILNATSAIIQNSPYKTYRLLLSRPIIHAFQDVERSESSVVRGVRDGYVGAQTLNIADVVTTGSLLPKILAPTMKSVSFGVQAFSPAGSLPSSRFNNMDGLAGDPSSASPLCSWLMYLARDQQSPVTRLAALRLLGLVYGTLTVETSSSAKDIERQMALLAVPMAVRLVQDAIPASSEDTRDKEEATVLREEAGSVFAVVIGNSLELQKASVDAGAIKHVSKMLRKTFDPITLARPMWSSGADTAGNTPRTETYAQLGQGGVPAEVAHVMKARAGALEALAAIAQREDAHRKAFIDQGIVNCLIDSLTPLSSDSLATLSSTKALREGNTTNVMVAACEAACALSRSVSLLRTSLIDAGIAKPILALLQLPDNALQVAATNVCCNLCLDFSPMRVDLMEANAVKIFCEHARRSFPALRVSSLWALKHLVLNAPRNIKAEALEELGAGWLVKAMTGEQRVDAMAGVSLGLSTSNAAGEQVDLLNAANSPDMDVDGAEGMGANDDDGEDELLYDANGTAYQSSGMRSTLKPNRQAMRHLRMLREKEQNVHLQARREDFEIQEQALDFVRNFINGEEAANMVDNLNAAIGVQRIFEILEAKLVGGHPRTQSQSSSADAIPRAVVLAATHVITQISAASARHRQLLIAQKPLLRAWLPHFGHPYQKIRVMCVWGVINLTWTEDQSDRDDARRRAHELRAIGIEDKVRALAGDHDLDTRERTKTAIRQLDELLAETARPR